MDHPSRPELGRTMTEMLTVIVVISVVVILSLSGFQHMRERIIANALQKAIGTNIVQRMHEIQGPDIYSAKPLTYIGPYKYPFHVESGTVSSGAKKEYYWITIGSFTEGTKRTLSSSLCQRLLNDLNLPVMPSAISVNDVPASLSDEACKYNLDGIVLTLYFPKKSGSNTASADGLINATYPRSCTSTSQCGGCQVCSHGRCVNDQSKCPAGTTCTEGFCKCSDERLACNTICCANNQVCGNLSVSQMSCISNNNLACMINADCDAPGKCSAGTGQCYCDVDYNAGVSPVELKDSTQCKPITPFTSQFQFNGKTFYIGPRTSYWSAENFCLAHEKQLATFDSLGLPNDFSCDATQTTCPLYHILNGINAPTAFYWTHSKHSSTYTRRLRFVQAKKEDSYPGIYSGAAILGGSSTSYTLCEDKLPDADIPEIPDNSCTSNDQCESSQVCTNGQCVLKTCERNEFTDINNQCVPCSDTARHTSTQTNCSACNGTREFIDNQYCDLICPSGYFKDDDGNCVPCTHPDQVQAEANECNKCNTTYARYMDIGWCKVGGDCATGYFKDESGACHLCSEASNIASTSQQCDKCSDRNFYNNTCYPACPTNSYFKDGDCQACVNGQKFALSSKCNPCNDNMKYVTSEATCKTCGDERFMMDVTENNTTITYCVRNCPDDHFRNTNGNCTICSFSQGRETSKEQCDRCATSYPRHMEGTYCKTGGDCATGYFKDSSGLCHQCTENNAISADSAQCALCDNRSMNSDNKCVLNNCPIGTFKDNSGNCTLCNQPGNIKADQNQCNLCSQRFYAHIANTWTCTVCTDENTFISIHDEDDWAECTNCGTTDVMVSVEASCNACSNRVFVAYNDGTRKGKCYSCDSGDVLPLTEAECNRCPSSSHRVYLGNNQCALACVAGETFLVSEVSDNFADVPPAGTCTACDNHYSSITTEEACANCSGQRTWVQNARGDMKNRCIWNGGFGWFQNKNLNWTKCSETKEKEIAATEAAEALCLRCNETSDKRKVTTKSGKKYCAKDT